jgi:hypothetical protein
MVESFVSLLDVGIVSLESCVGMEISACVCRGVLRVWGMRIQDSRTDFGGFWWKMVDGTSMRGWCKMESVSG